MSDALANTNLIAHEKALEAAGDAISLVLRVPAPLKSIADQVIRSASSVPANLAEGHGRSGRDRVHFWRIAYASAKEVDSHLRLLERAGVVNTGNVARVLETLDQVRADMEAHQPEDLNDHDVASRPSGRCRRRPPPALILPLSPVAAPVAGADPCTPDFERGECPSHQIPDEPNVRRLNVTRTSRAAPGSAGGHGGGRTTGRC